MKPIQLFIFLLISAGTFAQQTRSSDSIPLSINSQNTIFVKAVFNGTDTLNLNFDSGTTELVLTNDVLKNKLKYAIKLYDNLYSLQIGDSIYQTRVYDAALSGHGTDGRFGWDLFKGKVVELNYDKNLMIVHSALPDGVARNKKFQQLKMEFHQDLFLVESKIKQGKVTNKDLFLFDIGYQRTVMLSSDLLKQKKFPADKMEIIKKAIMHGAQGNEIPVITSNLKTLQIGKYKLKNVPAQLTTANKPFKDKEIHILGNEVLKRFNLLLDFQHNIVYLKPNHLFNDSYIDAKKNDS